jgi:hypothetical protein
MGGVNPTIQLAAALDRRGITVSIYFDRVKVRFHGHERMVIRPRTEGVKPCDYGREWTWHYGGDAGRHPRDDYEGTADAVEQFLRKMPALAETALIYRMNHMGWTFEQETQEALEQARRKEESDGQANMTAPEKAHRR